MSKRTFYYWISGSVSQESLFLVIHLSIAGPMHRNGRRVSVWTEEDEGDLIWMDTHSSLSVIRSFSLQANDTNWHFVEPLESWVSRTRCAVEVRRTCYDMVMSSFYARHLHIIIIEWVVGEDWGGGYEEHTSHWQDTLWIWYIFVLLSTNSMPCRHEGSSFTFTPMECSVCQCCCCWIIRGIVMVCHDLANNNRVVLLMNLKLQSIIDPRLT